MANRDAVLNAGRRAQNLTKCIAADHGFPNCVGQIVKAHTVQEASLRSIADDGRVIGLRVDIATYGTKGIRFEPIGVRNASTFTGFCSKHDDEIFAPAEKEPFEFRASQVAALHYRVLARELYKKETLVRVNALVARAGKQPQMDRGTAAGLRDSRHWAERAARAIRNGSDDETGWFGCELATPPPVMCAGGYFPDIDLNGKPLQDLMRLDDVAAGVSVNLFSSFGKGFGVIAWSNNRSEKIAPLIEQLRRCGPAELASELAELAIQRFENIFFEPHWFDALEAPIKSWMTLCVRCSVEPYLPAHAPKPPARLSMPAVVSIVESQQRDR